MLTSRVVFGSLAVGLLLSMVLPCASAAAPQDSRLKDLLKERLALAKEFAVQTETGYKTGSVPMTQLLLAKEAVFKAELDLCESDKERLAVLEKMVALTKEHEEVVAKMIQSGGLPNRALVEAKLKRLEAEIALERPKPK
jgi:hypothetical protein